MSNHGTKSRKINEQHSHSHKACDQEVLWTQDLWDCNNSWYESKTAVFLKAELPNHQLEQWKCQRAFNLDMIICLWPNFTADIISRQEKY